MIADPKALQYILHTSNYNFPKSPDASHTIRMLTGDGVGCTKGKSILNLIMLTYKDYAQEKFTGVREKSWPRHFLYHI